MVGERLEQVMDTIAMLRLTLWNTQLASLTLQQREQLVDLRSSLYQQYDQLICKMNKVTNLEEASIIEVKMDELADKINEVDEQLTETDVTITGLITAPSQPFHIKTTTQRMAIDRVQSTMTKMNFSANRVGSISSLVLSPLYDFVSPHLGLHPLCFQFSKIHRTNPILFLLHDLRCLIHSFFTSFLSLYLSCLLLILRMTLYATSQALPRILIYLLILSLSFPYTLAAIIGHIYPSSTLSIYALNANGMHHALKIVHVNNTIIYRNPSIFVISELKSLTMVAG